MQYREIYRLVLHPNFVDLTKQNVSLKVMDYDFAIAFMPEPLKYTLGIRSVTLAKKVDIGPNDEVFAVGWGEESRLKTHLTPRKFATPKLKGIKLTLMNIWECQKNYSDIGVSITHRFFCASSPEGGTCYGDAGGPALKGNLQYGVISYATACLHRGCPSLFSRVPLVYDWIKTTAGAVHLTTQDLIICLLILVHIWRNI